MKSKDGNRRFWNRFSAFYDLIINKDSKAYRILTDQIKQELHPETRVLELATGTGIIGIAVAPFCKSVEATDFSEKMIQKARRKEKPENVTLSIQDATRLPYPAKSFDAVIISNALHIMPNPELALQNIRRVLKDDGVMIAPTFMRSTNLKEKLLEKPMELFGFVTFSRWTFSDYLQFIEKNHFKIEKSCLIEARFPIAYVVSKKSETHGM